MYSYSLARMRIGMAEEEKEEKWKKMKKIWDNEEWW